MDAAACFNKAKTSYLYVLSTNAHEHHRVVAAVVAAAAAAVDTDDDHAEDDDVDGIRILEREPMVLPTRR